MLMATLKVVRGVGKFISSFINNETRPPVTQKLGSRNWCLISESIPSVQFTVWLVGELKDGNEYKARKFLNKSWHRCYGIKIPHELKKSHCASLKEHLKCV